MQKKIYLIITLAVLAMAVLLIFVGGIVIGRPAGKFMGQRPLSALIITNPPALDNAVAGFRDGLTLRGYIENENIFYKEIPIANDLDSTIANLRVNLTKDYDIVYSTGILAVRAAKTIIDEKQFGTPLVFGVVSDPVGSGLVESMQSSGNNLVGVTPANEIVSAKRLEIFLRALPSLNRIIIGWTNADTTGIELLRKAASELGVELIEKQIADKNELLNFITGHQYLPEDGILRATDSVNAQALQELVDFSIVHKIPLMGTNSLDSQRGALLSYGANYYNIGQQSARLADLIFKGAKPADLPNELPDEFEFVINAATAETIGVNLSDEALLEATQVIR
jgi:putative ABC transport system substrate-binding protein